MGELDPVMAQRVWDAAETTGHTSPPEPFAPCPTTCRLGDEPHRHYRRAPGAYFKLRRPTECCGREWARWDEVLILDQCAWCREDGRALPGLIRLIYPTTAARGRRRTGRR